MSPESEPLSDPGDTRAVPGPRLRKPVEDRVFDGKSMAVGLLVALVIFSLAFLWRVKAVQTARRADIRDFEFSMAEPNQEEIKVPNPARDFLRVADPESLNLTAAEERPDVHFTRAANDTPVYTEVIQARSPGTMSASDIKEFKIDVRDFQPDAAGAETVVDDNPETITFAAERAEYAIPLIAADTRVAADLFKYDHPAPPDAIASYTFNVGPRPGRAMRRLPEAFGDQDAPSFGRLGPANINLFGTGDIFRSMGRAGGLRARSAVDNSLHWLAMHQEPDGMWDAAKHEGAEPGSLGSTGLSVLALMSGGHTVRKGEYSRTVLKGLEAIIRHQNEEGHISDRGVNLYTHAICTIALAEAFGRARDERVGAAAQRAINFCERAVATDGGWRYEPKPPASDMSVTAWFIQALKTAKIAGLKTDDQIFNQALAFVDSVTDKGGSKDTNGYVGYMFEEGQNYNAGSSHSGGKPALTAAAMMLREFHGLSPRNSLLVKGAENVKNSPPRWDQKDAYYWYYATYAMHNMGGAYRIWWNQKIRDVLLDNQSREGDRAGSWDPAGDARSNPGGRVYCTALGALCLEVYYRYSEALTSFGTAPDLDDLLSE
ncbi:MAG: hypothetical protein ABSG86_25965 [Thermoguttaceae bacterium]|jgi:hypothetical protein